MADTLTLQTFLDAKRRLDEIVGPTLTRPEIFISDYLPKEERPVCHIKLAHPLIVWLCKWLPMSPWAWLEGVEEEERAYVIGGRTYMSSRAFAALKSAEPPDA